MAQDELKENSRYIRKSRNTEELMIGICPKCGNYEWNKQVTEDNIVLDADFLFNIMPHNTDEDYKNWVEQILSLSKM